MPNITVNELTAIVDELFELREEYRRLNKIAEDKKHEYSTKEKEVISLLRKAKEEGLASITTSKATVAVVQEIVPNINDWDAFLTWAKANDMLYMLYRQIKTTTFREYLEGFGTTPPGLSSVTLHKLTLQKRD